MLPRLHLCVNLEFFAIASMCLRVPLSLCCLQWGYWRSRWNAADISSGATNKSIKQHTHTHTRKDTWTHKSKHIIKLKSCIPHLPQHGMALGVGHKVQLTHQRLFFPHYKKWSQHKRRFLKWVTHPLKFAFHMMTGFKTKTSFCHLHMISFKKYLKGEDIHKGFGFSHPFFFFFLTECSLLIVHRGTVRKPQRRQFYEEQNIAEKCAHPLMPNTIF